jgi:hypothetical protein
VQGGTLTAGTGTWTNTPTSFAYAWQECDASGNPCHEIPGATKSTYVPAGFNVGDTIRVAVTATNAGGSSSATSEATARVTAAQGQVTVGPPQISGPTATVPIACENSSFILICELFFNFTLGQPPLGPPPPPPSPSEVTTAARSQRVKHRAKVVNVGKAKVKIPAGHQKNVRITLNRTGRRLLAKEHTLKVKLTVTQNGHIVRTKTITFRAKSPRKH